MFKSATSKKIWLVMFCLITTFTYPAFGGKSASARQVFDLSIGFRNSQFYRVSNLPLSIRDVPVHKDDGFHGLEPLPDRSFAFPRSVSFDAEISFYLLPYISLGGGITYNPSPPSGVNGKNRYQQNQYGNSERGYGTSLRWYNVHLMNFQFVLTGSLVSPWLRFPPGLAFRTKAGGHYYPGGLKFFSSAGWDRWDKDQIWKSEVIARLYQQNLFLELDLAFHEFQDNYEPKFVYLYFRILKSYDRFKLEDDFKDIVFERGTTPTISIGIGLDVAFR